MSLDWYDRQIMQFALRWMPFGGPPEDEMLPRFGLTPGEFRTRFEEIVSNLSRNSRSLNEQDSELLASALTTSISAPQAVSSITWASRTPR
jgi:hypothetical protein